MGTRILVALVYFYVVGCLLWTATATLHFALPARDISMRNLSYAIRWSAILLGIWSACFALLIPVSFFKKNWFRPLLVVVTALGIVVAVGMEIALIRNAAALSFTPLTVWDVLSALPKLFLAKWTLYGGEVLRPVLVWLYLYKLRPMDVYFARFAEHRSPQSSCS